MSPSSGCIYITVAGSNSCCCPQYPQEHGDYSGFNYKCSPFYLCVLCCHVWLSCQSGVQPEMEGGQLHSDTQHQQVQPRHGDQCSDQLHLQTSASAEALPVKWDQKETPVDVQERGNSAGQHQGKPLWKPIPPLLPEPHRNTTTQTRDQSCQTEEQFLQTSACKHGQNTGEYDCCVQTQAVALKVLSRPFIPFS